MPSKMWNEITYPFPNFKDFTAEVLGMAKLFDFTLYDDVITYPCKQKGH